MEQISLRQANSRLHKINTQISILQNWQEKVQKNTQNYNKTVEIVGKFEFL